MFKGLPASEVDGEECRSFWKRGARVGRQAAMMEVHGSISDQMIRLVVISVFPKEESNSQS